MILDRFGYEEMHLFRKLSTALLLINSPAHCCDVWPELFAMIFSVTMLRIKSVPNLMVMTE